MFEALNRQPPTWHARIRIPFRKIQGITNSKNKTQQSHSEFDLPHPQSNNDVSFASLVLGCSKGMFPPTWRPRIFLKPCLAPTSRPRFDPCNPLARHDSSSLGFLPIPTSSGYSLFWLALLEGVSGRFYTSRLRFFGVLSRQAI